MLSLRHTLFGLRDREIKAHYERLHKCTSWNQLFFENIELDKEIRLQRLRHNSMWQSPKLAEQAMLDMVKKIDDPAFMGDDPVQLGGTPRLPNYLMFMASGLFGGVDRFRNDRFHNVAVMAEAIVQLYDRYPAEVYKLLDAICELFKGFGEFTIPAHLIETEPSAADFAMATRLVYKLTLTMFGPERAQAVATHMLTKAVPQVMIDSLLALDFAYGDVVLALCQQLESPGGPPGEIEVPGNCV